jgi:tRNA (cmo5U34)-methyltransferase
LRQDEVWKGDALARTFLREVRGGIPFGAEQIEVMLRLLEAGGRPIGRFLDLGSGGGILAAAVLHLFPGAQGTLVDFSEPMMAEARQLLQARFPALLFALADFGDPGWLRWVLGRAPFDAVVSGYAIHHQPDPRKRELYREIFDLLAPGGLFVNLEHVSSPSPWVEKLYEEQFVDSLFGFQRSRGSKKSREEVAEEFLRRPDKEANILAPVEDQCGWLREIGFADVDCYFKTFELAVFGGRRSAR